MALLNPPAVPVLHRQMARPMEFRDYAARELAALADKLADAAKSQIDAASSQVTATYEATIEKLRTDQTQIVTDNERLTAENAALSWEKNGLLDSAEESRRGVLIDHLLDVFQRIAVSTSVDDVLIATAFGLATDFGRVAVFAGGERRVQLGTETPPLDLNSPSAITVPFTVRGEAIAVICAADETRADGEGARLAELLRRHATLALDRLTIELKTIAELRAYAQMLLDEVEYVFEADTVGKLRAADRSERLQENLRCARQIYHQRVTLEGPAAASVLQEMIRRTIASRVGTAFGQELADLEDRAEYTRSGASWSP